MPPRISMRCKRPEIEKKAQLRMMDPTIIEGMSDVSLDEQAAKEVSS